MLIKCPYCGAELEKPKRKRKCPNCKNTFYVVSKLSFPLKRDAFREEEIEIVRQLNRLYGLFPQLAGLIPANFWEKVEGNLKENFDYIAYELNKVADDILLIHGESARPLQDFFMFAYTVTGKDTYKEVANWIVERVLQIQIERMLKIGIKKVKILAVGDRLTCKSCKKLDGKVYNIKTFLEKMPIPHKCSSEKGCRCTIVAVF